MTDGHSTPLTPSQSISTDPPEWAAALLERVAALESRPFPGPVTAGPALDDPFITERSPETDFQPYPAFEQALPGFNKDYFCNPLPQVERRRFLSNCPRNVAREYHPPTLNNVNISPAARRMDHQLSEIQFRLSGLTRPLDYFLHKTLPNFAGYWVCAVSFGLLILNELISPILRRDVWVSVFPILHTSTPLLLNLVDNLTRFFLASKSTTLFVIFETPSNTSVQQRISKHIQSIMVLLPQVSNQHRIKARALGSSRAVRAGAGVDDVVTHGFWSSKTMFDTFYRLSRETQTNFTTLALGGAHSSSSALDSQSMDPQNDG
ncbi:hypothetical protein EC973_006326 [Apophysomyces ossiformis]|uniref:Uncharacterized protein n=1 Tax=Apophysomyces ossiformis TaxID=679940 RepID=A0A8H7C0Q4_9FUNG|nr:hypothetical protein EC973_006326 [Apophysomyces ossiformis]